MHLVDVSEEATLAPLEALRVVERELEEYSVTLAARPRILVATKCEDEESEARALALAQAAGRSVRAISAVTGAGMKELLAEAFLLARSPAPGTGP